MENFDTRTIPISLSSSDRDHALYPNPNRYRVDFPYPIQEVLAIQLASLELPTLKTQYTIETGVNDRFTFSEGLRVDLGEALHTDVDGTGTSMYNNQIGIKEDSNMYVVSVPAYLSQVTGYDGSDDSLETPDTAASGAASWYACYVAYRNSLSTKPPPLQVLGSMAGYVEHMTTGGTIGDTSNLDDFVGGFVYMAPLSVRELCGYLTYAFANYATYAASPAASMQRDYTFEYFRGKVRVHAQAKSTSAPSPTLHFPQTKNATQTVWKGSQDMGFTNQMELNRTTGTVTSLGYMLGFSSNLSLTSKRFDTQRRQVSMTGFHAHVAPRFLFEGRFPAGLYSQSDLATHLPRVMNPLHFRSALNTATTGACYFGFIDSAKQEKIVVINEGKYTPETFCHAVAHALNRLDSNGPYYSQSRFGTRDTPLNHETDGTQQTTRKNLSYTDAVLYNMYYDFDTSKFTIESSYGTIKPNDPSTAVVLNTSKPAPSFGLLFDPQTLARIAPTVSGLTASLCTSSNVDRIANVLGFRLQDYLGETAYTSRNPSYIPRILFPLSQNMEPDTGKRRLFEYEEPSKFGLDRGDATGAGVPKYLYPSGRYRAVGMVPATQCLNVSTAGTRPFASSATHRSTEGTSTVDVTVTNFGYLSSEYALSSGGAQWTAGMYAVVDHSAGSLPPASTMLDVLTTTTNATTPAATIGLVDIGTGTAAGAQSFSPIQAHDNVRMTTVTNSNNGRCALFSTHTNGWTTDGQAYATTMPFGVQVSDVVKVKSINEAWQTQARASTITVQTPSELTLSQGFPKSSTITATVGSMVSGQYYLVLGGNRDAMLLATSTTEASVVDIGSGYYPSTSYNLSHPCHPFEVEGVVVHQHNAGAHHTDTDNSQREQFHLNVPKLGSSFSCTAARSVDGSCIRVRIPEGDDPAHVSAPTGIFQSLNGSEPMAGNTQRLSKYDSDRFDVHIEDNNPYTQTKTKHANAILGIQRTDLKMSRTTMFPFAMDVNPTPYIMLQFQNLHSVKSKQIHYTGKLVMDNVVGKVVMAAPVSISRTMFTTVEMLPQTLDHIELAFYLPDGKTLYPFHGLNHSLTINLVVKSFKRGRQ